MYLITDGLVHVGKDKGHGRLVHSGPLYRGHTVEGNRIRIAFDHVGQGLDSRDGKPLSHFEVGDLTRFYPAQATIYPITVNYLENRGNEFLDVLYEGPNFDKRSLTDQVLFQQR